VEKGHVRHVPDDARQAELMAAFRSALETGDANRLARTLRADAKMRADSGGKVAAIRRVIEGQSDICRSVSAVLSPAWRGMRLSARTINGMQGLFVEDRAEPIASVSFSYDPDGTVRDIFIMGHPDKLDLLKRTSGLAAAQGALWIA
jgi:RNA polymerase sigma-70 factor (ECF subfamily)